MKRSKKALPAAVRTGPVRGAGRAGKKSAFARLFVGLAGRPVSVAVFDHQGAAPLLGSVKKLLNGRG